MTPRNPNARRDGHTTTDRWTAEEWAIVSRLTAGGRRAAVLVAAAQATARSAPEVPDGWAPSKWWTARMGPKWWLQVSRGNVLVTPADDGGGYAWSLPYGYPDDAVHTAPDLHTAQYRAEAALRAAGEVVP